MTVPEIQKWPFFNGESRTFYPFLPLFRGESRKKCENTPYYYPFKDIFPILYPISREVKDKILKEKKIPLNNASLHTLPGINTYYKHCYGYGAIYEYEWLYEYAWLKALFNNFSL